MNSYGFKTLASEIVSCSHEVYIHVGKLLVLVAHASQYMLSASLSLSISLPLLPHMPKV